MKLILFFWYHSLKAVLVTIFYHFEFINFKLFKLHFTEIQFINNLISIRISTWADFDKKMSLNWYTIYSNPNLFPPDQFQPESVPNQSILLVTFTQHHFCTESYFYIVSFYHELSLIMTRLFTERFVCIVSIFTGVIYCASCHLCTAYFFFKIWWN